MIENATRDTWHLDAIRLWNVTTHNLRGIDVSIPLGRFTVICGVSGSGKSSLAFDTLHAEGQRRYIETFSPYSRQFLPKYEKPSVERVEGIPPSVAVGRRIRAAGGHATVATAAGIADYLRFAFARLATIVCPECGVEVRSHDPERIAEALVGSNLGEPVTIAFPIESPGGDGLESLLRRLREDGFLRVQFGDDILRTDQSTIPAPDHPQAIRVLVDRCRPTPEAFRRLVDSIETAMAHGEGRVDILAGDSWRSHFDRSICPTCKVIYPEPDPTLFLTSNKEAACPTCAGKGEVEFTPNDGVERGVRACPTCHGMRFQPKVLAYRLFQLSFPELLAMTAARAADVVREGLMLDNDSPRDSTSRHLLDQLSRRLNYLVGVGLGYLSLDRLVRTLSAGETRRVTLTTVFAAGLAKTLFVLDEPTAGLHPRDRRRLIDAIRDLRDADNTVVAVEHDPLVLDSADHAIEVGPGAGADGGRLLFEGSPVEMRECRQSTLAPYLRATPSLRPETRRPRGMLRLRGARAHNLKSIDVQFPLGVLTAVAGVSGAGKSSLVLDTLYPSLAVAMRGSIPDFDLCDGLDGFEGVDAVELVDDRSIGRTSRANAATYMKFFGDVRRLFAESADARIGGVSAGDFSFNRPGGRCETCEGAGQLRIDMLFLPEATITCPDCGGRRYRPHVLTVKCRGRTIAEVLEMSVREAFGFFRAERRIQMRLAAMKEIGLDYLPIGRPLSTLSGGEVQRLKLASHLAEQTRSRVLFLLEEPTIGLHPADVDRMLSSLQWLVDSGHTVIVVEHNLQVLARADHIIELGPGPAEEGGQIVAEGSPMRIAGLDTPTAVALRRYGNSK